MGENISIGEAEILLALYATGYSTPHHKRVFLLETEALKGIPQSTITAPHIHSTVRINIDRLRSLREEQGSI